MPDPDAGTAERERLAQSQRREQNWKRWGPYLAERQWGTVREDYSAQGNPWRYFPHDHARSRAYRWGEDGLLGFCDRECRLCFAPALWNGRDPILKERLFGLSNPEGNHGEDVKEVYFYLDSGPSHAYAKALYRYPQTAFPYEQLVRENERRTAHQREFEITDAGVFDDQRYFDLFVEYAKRSPNDLMIRLTIVNRGPERAPLDLLPTLWFRNTWAWGRPTGETTGAEPSLCLSGADRVVAEHESLGRFLLSLDQATIHEQARWLFTNNETNDQRLFGVSNPAAYVKDAFHRRVVDGEKVAVNPDERGTKCAAWLSMSLEAGEQRTIRLRLSHEDESPDQSFDPSYDRLFTQRIEETDAFYSSHFTTQTGEEQARIGREAYAGLLWNRQFYHYVVEQWLEGDPAQPPPPGGHKRIRNTNWRHLYNYDVMSMPDKWEYPWYAAWDLAFHMVPMARIDREFTKKQLLVLLREWYMHPSGTLPAYEFDFSALNPPVHAWACWRAYDLWKRQDHPDRAFLERVFQKLLLNFTWWVNRQDRDGNDIFSGGFLGLDNIGVIDRSQVQAEGGALDQADGTAWMAFYCSVMLTIALELAEPGNGYEDLASKFFEHYIHIAHAMNGFGAGGLWDEQDGFYYDKLHFDGRVTQMRVRSVVGLIPLLTAQVITQHTFDRLPGFRKRTRWFLQHRPDLTQPITCLEPNRDSQQPRYLLAMPTRDRLVRMLQYMLDENEFLSPFGIRSLSRYHQQHPFELTLNGQQHRITYEPGESTSGMFGGNSNWRGPVWFPLNYLIIEALQCYHHFYGEEMTFAYPTGAEKQYNLRQVAADLSQRLQRLFLPDEHGHRPFQGEDPCFASTSHFQDKLLFHEYFHAETGRGLGASHQTGWTALISELTTSEHA